MSRPSLRIIPVIACAAVALLAAGCGESGIQVAKSDPLYDGARIFQQRCAGCHTLDAAGAEGSAKRVNDREYKDGPNFNQRKVKYEDVLYAIRNGGFSSGPMPQNIVTGREAELVACFLATNSGKQQVNVPTPGKQPAAGAGRDDCKQQLASR